MKFNQFLEKKESELPKDVEKAREKAGGSNVGKDRETSGAKKGPFCGPAGNAPKGSFPVTNKKQAAACNKVVNFTDNISIISK